MKFEKDVFHKDYKFIRDQLFCKDIEGAFPVKKVLKKPYIPEEIKGTSPKKHIREMRVDNDKNYLDITRKSKRKINHRGTNPLNPVYEMVYNKK